MSSVTPNLSDWFKGDLVHLVEWLPIPLAITQLDKDRRVLYINQQFNQTFGYSLEDIPTVYRWAELAIQTMNTERRLLSSGIVP